MVFRECISLRCARSRSSAGQFDGRMNGCGDMRLKKKQKQGWSLFAADLSSLDEKSLLFQDRRIAVHQMCQSAEVVLVQEGNCELGLLERRFSAKGKKWRLMREHTAPLIPNALMTRHLVPPVSNQSHCDIPQEPTIYHPVAAFASGWVYPTAHR